MADSLIAAGVAPDRLVLDESSLDTLQTGLAAAAFIRAEGLAGAIVCTDSYHAPRTRLILCALGIATRDGSVAAGPRQMGAFDCWRMRLREVPAIPYDAILAFAKRGRVSEP